MRRFPLFLAIFLGMLALDQLTKHWARSGFAVGQVFPLWPGVFELTLTYNRGIAFGLFEGAGHLFAPIAIAIAVGAGAFSYRHPSEPKVAHVALGLMAAGAIGNLIDRMWLGKVTDMFWIRAVNFPVFNVADVCITFAAAVLAVVWMRDASPKGRRKDLDLQRNPSETE